MQDFPSSLEPWPDSRSGETFLASTAEETVVLRIYGPHSAHRGPLAPEVDAAVLTLVAPFVPRPHVLEARRGDPDMDLPGLLVTSRLPGEPLDVLLPHLDEQRGEMLGSRLGTLVARLGHMVQARRGFFTGQSLVPGAAPGSRPGPTPDLVTALSGRVTGLDDEATRHLLRLAEPAQDLIDEDSRACVVHGNLVPRHLRVDPETLVVTGLAGWGRAHSGSPWTDLGSLLRALPRAPAEGVLAGYRDLMPVVPPDVEARARAADLAALVDRANAPAAPVRDEARSALVKIAAAHRGTRP